MLVAPARSSDLRFRRISLWNEATSIVTTLIASFKIWSHPKIEFCRKCFSRTHSSRFLSECRIVPRMKDCIFCNVVDTNEPHHEIWWQDDFHIAFLDLSPTTRGHTLLIPRNHSGDIFEMTEESYINLMLAIKKVGTRMKEFFDVPRVAVMLEGMHVDHTHVHLYPIKNKGALGVFAEYDLKEGELEELGKELRKSKD